MTGMKCPNCGMSSPSDALLCPRCGYRLSDRAGGSSVLRSCVVALLVVIAFAAAGVCFANLALGAHDAVVSVLWAGAFVLFLLAAFVGYAARRVAVHEEQDKRL